MAINAEGEKNVERSGTEIDSDEKERVTKPKTSTQ